MRANDLLDVIGDAKDEYIHTAKKNKKSKIPRWIKSVSSIAACLVLIVGAGAFIIMIGGEAGGGGNSDAGLTYMYYTGPVLPLTLGEDNDAVIASRNVDYDFSPYISYEESYETANGETKTYFHSRSQSIITDSYVLTNQGSEDITVTGVYPFVSDFGSTEYHPAITVNGNEIQTDMHPGPYSGGYAGVWGAANQEEGSLNLAPLDSFAGYESLLSNDSYMTAAFDEFPALDQPVIVYKMSDYVYISNPDATNPTLNMEFYIDYDKTCVLTYGINGGSYNYESGYCARHNGAIELRPNASPENVVPEDAYIILVGEDLHSYTVQGYMDGGCDRGEELDDLSCTITRYETTLGELLRQIINENYTDSTYESHMLYNLTAELITTAGPLGEVVQRYDEGMLETIISEAGSHDRVIYLTFELSIPAGESVAVKAIMLKDASMDFVGDDTERNGYDMATQLGSNLKFSEQIASISGYDEIEILRQNFGFDIAAGITRVQLDMNEPHYWIEVKKVQPEDRQ